MKVVNKAVRALWGFRVFENRKNRRPDPFSFLSLVVIRLVLLLKLRL